MNRGFTRERHFGATLPSIFAANLRSIRNKFDDFVCQVLTQNADLVICSETWLNSNLPIAAFNVPGYSCFRSDRKYDIRGGGVAVWTKRSFQGEGISFPDLDHVEVCALKLTNSGLLVFGIYLPPGLPSSAFCLFRDTLEVFLDNFFIFLSPFPCNYCW